MSNKNWTHVKNTITVINCLFLRSCLRQCVAACRTATWRLTTLSLTGASPSRSASSSRPRPWSSPPTPHPCRFPIATLKWYAQIYFWYHCNLFPLIYCISSLKCTKCIQSVPFRPTTVQIPNRALTVRRNWVQCMCTVSLFLWVVFFSFVKFGWRDSPSSVKD